MACSVPAVRHAVHAAFGPAGRQFPGLGAGDIRKMGWMVTDVQETAAGWRTDATPYLFALKSFCEVSGFGDHWAGRN